MDEDFGHLDFLWEAKPLAIILNELINEKRKPVINIPRNANSTLGEKKEPLTMTALFKEQLKQQSSRIGIA